MFLFRFRFCGTVRNTWRWTSNYTWISIRDPTVVGSLRITKLGQYENDQGRNVIENTLFTWLS